MATTWFRQLFGVEESRIYAAAQASFRLGPNPGEMTSVANGKTFQIGRFDTPTLQSLREQGLNALKAASKDSLRPFKFQHVAQGDVLPEHAKYPGALFQAASQFNCLEFPTASTTPEEGVSFYAFDHTQGPACSLACAAGTVFRNYFVDVKQKAGAGNAPPTCSTEGDLSHLGQREHRQLDNLDLLQEALQNQVHQYFYVRNGYTFTSHEKHLQSLNAVIRASRQAHAVSSVEEGAEKGTAMAPPDLLYEEFKGLVKIGVHSDVGVDFQRRFEPAPEGLRVSQAYCSALSCGYSGTSNTYWEPLARLVLEAAYEATLWAGVLNALHPSPSLDTHSATTASDCPTETNGLHPRPLTQHREKVFLTFLGGGVFRNDMGWICDSIGRALAVMALHEAPIEVLIAHYGGIKPEIEQRVGEAYARELEALKAARV